MKATHNEYYITIGGDTKVCCPESRTDKNDIIIWFQNNRKKLEEEYGAELISKAKLVEETVEINYIPTTDSYVTITRSLKLYKEKL